MFSKLKIKCFSNVDVNGKWDKFDVEKEMRELIGPNHKFEENEWIEWVLTHVFDFGNELPKTIFDAICDEHVEKIEFKMDFGKVTVEKSF